MENARIERHRKANKKSNQDVIAEIEIEAYAHGMSYGQWVALQYMKGQKHERVKTG